MTRAEAERLDRIERKLDDLVCLLGRQVSVLKDQVQNGREYADIIRDQNDVLERVIERLSGPSVPVRRQRRLTGSARHLHAVREE